MVNNPFRRPQSSYEGPVPLVLVDPDVDKDVTVCFNSAWLPYVTGALSQLTLPTTWDTDDDTERLEQIQRATLLIAMFTTPCGGELEVFDVRQNEEEPCSLEKSTDEGETWVSFADLQLCPPRIRTSKGKLQWFDGTSWVDVPGGADERYDGESEPQWTDPPVGEDGACLAAENIVASYVTMLTQTKAGVDAVATISGIVDIVAGYIGTQTLFPPALFILNISLAVGALAVLGSEAIEDLIDSPNVDVLKCIIKCHASSDGAFTAAEFDDIKDDIDDQISDPEKLIMTEWINSYGPVGLTRIAAANGIEDGDCGTCDCNIVTFTYDTGSGPANAGIDDLVTFVGVPSTDGKGYVQVQTAPCVTLEFVSSSSTPYEGFGGSQGWWPCGSTTFTASSTGFHDTVSLHLLALWTDSGTGTTTWRVTSVD